MSERTDMFLLEDETLTPEGLAIEAQPADDGSTLVREVGHFGYVIYEYRVRPDEAPFLSYAIQEPHAEFLVRRVAELERRCAERITAGVVDIDAARWKWNFKAAKRRLRRYIKEKEVQLLEIPPEFHELAKRVLQEAPESPPEFDGEALNKRLWEEGAIHEFYDYERRKAERVVLVVSGLPAELGALLAEANETYFHGLFRATIALCRAVLEDVFRRVVRLRHTGVGPIPINEDHLDVLINCLPSELLSPKAKTVAHEIRQRGNQALHSAEADFAEDETWRVLTLTGRLVELLVNRGGLVQSSGGA